MDKPKRPGEYVGHGTFVGYLCGEADAYMDYLKARNRKVVEVLRRAKREHYYCEDSWYSCPKAEDGCADERRGPECDCGADKWNAEIDAVLAEEEETYG